MRKVKTTGDVTLVDISQSTLGVRTRAKTLALRRLQSSAASSSENRDSYCYLELRSRRLEKTPLLQAPRRVRRGCGSVGDLYSCSIEIEASLGENDLNEEVMERDTQESTRCSSTIGTSVVLAPGSSSSNRSGAVNSFFMTVPTPVEVDNYFSHEEQGLQHLFAEKYNFDFVNELPLPGRYEWVRVSPD